MLKLYAGKSPKPAFKGQIRDMRTMWQLEEHETPYEIQYVAARTDTSQPWFLELNPFGRFPVIQDSTTTLFESVAIALYLADKHRHLIPAHGNPARATHDQWLMAAVANLEFNALRVFACDVIFDAGEETDAKRKAALEIVHSWLPGFEQRLSKSPYLNGEEFQVCDLILSSILGHCHSKGELKDYPKLTSFLETNFRRPAYQRAYEKNGG